MLSLKPWYNLRSPLQPSRFLQFVPFSFSRPYSASLKCSTVQASSYTSHPGHHLPAIRPIVNIVAEFQLQSLNLLTSDFSVSGSPKRSSQGLESVCSCLFGFRFGDRIISVSPFHWFRCVSVHRLYNTFCRPFDFTYLEYSRVRRSARCRYAKFRFRGTLVHL